MVLVVRVIDLCWFCPLIPEVCSALVFHGWSYFKLDDLWSFMIFLVKFDNWSFLSFYIEKKPHFCFVGSSLQNLPVLESFKFEADNFFV